MPQRKGGIALSLSFLRHSAPSAMTATIAPLPKCREAPACFDVPWAFEKVVLGPPITNAKNGRYLTDDAVIDFLRDSVAGQRSCNLYSDVFSFAIFALAIPLLCLCHCHCHHVSIQKGDDLEAPDHYAVPQPNCPRIALNGAEQTHITALDACAVVVTSYISIIVTILSLLLPSRGSADPLHVQ